MKVNKEFAYEFNNSEPQNYL